jgi:tripeptidyl-peptidase-1
MIPSRVPNEVGIAGFNNEFPSPQDLQWFMIAFRTDAIAASFDLKQMYGGGFDASNPGLVANLNMQYAQAMAFPTPHIFYSIGGDPTWSVSSDGEPIPGDSYVVWLGSMLSLDNIPPTIIITYGANESSYPKPYAEFVCEMFGKLGLRGVSVLFSSGDDGVGPGSCKDDKGNVQFIPKFPASCMSYLSLQGVHKRGYKSLTTLPLLRRSLGH